MLNTVHLQGPECPFPEQENLMPRKQSWQHPQRERESPPRGSVKFEKLKSMCTSTRYSEEKKRRRNQNSSQKRGAGETSDSFFTSLRRPVACAREGSVRGPFLHKYYRKDSFRNYYSEISFVNSCLVKNDQLSGTLLSCLIGVYPPCPDYYFNRLLNRKNKSSVNI